MVNERKCIKRMRWQDPAVRTGNSRFEGYNGYSKNTSSYARSEQYGIPPSRASEQVHALVCIRSGRLGPSCQMPLARSSFRRCLLRHVPAILCSYEKDTVCLSQLVNCGGLVVLAAEAQACVIA